MARRERLVGNLCLEIGKLVRPPPSRVPAPNATAVVSGRNSGKFFCAACIARGDLLMGHLIFPRAPLVSQARRT